MFKPAGTLILLVLVVMALVPLPVYDVVAQQQVTLTYVTLSLRTLYGSEASDTTYELYIPLPKSVWSGCRDFEVYTSSGVKVPVWVFECYDGDAGVPIHSPQLTLTSSTPSAGWDTNPYFDDGSWTRFLGGAGGDQDYNIKYMVTLATTFYYRYVVNLPIKPSSAVLHVRVGNDYSGTTSTFNACPGGNCLVKVNGQPFGTAVSLTASRASYNFDVTNVVQAGLNVITTIVTNNPPHGEKRFGIQLTAYYNGYYIARVYARIPVQLSTTPTNIHVFYKLNANVKDPRAFIFFDDFDTFDSSKYTVSGLTVSASGGVVTLSTTSSGSITVAGLNLQPPVASIARINSNILQSSVATYVRFQAGGTTVLEIVVNTGSTAPNTIPSTAAFVYNGVWPWITGFTATSSTTAFMVLGQRYSSVFTTISPLSRAHSAVTVSSYTPGIALAAASSGYTVGVTLDWLAVFKPPLDFRNPAYTASIHTSTLSLYKTVLPGSGAPANLLVFRFNTTLYGGDIYNSGLLTGQGLITTSSHATGYYNVTSFPSRSILALQFTYTKPFTVIIGYVHPDGSTTPLEKLLYNGSVVQLLDQSNVVVASVSGVQAPGYIQLDVFGSERRLHVYSQETVKQATGTSTLITSNIILHTGISNIMVMEGLFTTFTQNGLLAVKITGVDARGRNIELYVPDARSPTAVGVDLDATPEIITVGVPLGVYPVKANITAYLDAQTIQYSLIIPPIEIPTQTINIGSQQATGPIASILANTLNKIGAMVGGEHRPLIATAVVLTLTFLATLTTAPLVAVIAAVALIAMAIAGWVNLPVALIAVFIVVAVITARRYTR